MPSRDSASHERPRKDWVEIPVPALVSEETFALAQEQLEHNKRHSPRRTTDPTLLQGMLVCQQCGYALYRTWTRTTKQKINYYRCIGSDRYRRLQGPVCQNRPIRQDYLDAFVWTEVIRLLDDPALIQTESIAGSRWHRIRTLHGNASRVYASGNRGWRAARSAWSPRIRRN